MLSSASPRTHWIMRRLVVFRCGKRLRRIPIMLEASMKVTNADVLVVAWLGCRVGSLVGCSTGLYGRYVGSLLVSMADSSVGRS